MINTKTNRFSIKEFYRLIIGAIKFHYAGFATWSIFLTLLLLSILSGLRYESSNQLYMAGEIAKSDVIAERTLRVEDPYATQLRREQTMALQPLVFDLNKANVQNFRTNILDLLTSINSQGLDINSLEAIQKAFNTKFSSELSREFFANLGYEEVQTYLTENLIPHAEILLNEGIFADRKQLTSTPSAILIRDSKTGAESLLVPGNHPLPDLYSFYLNIGQELNKSGLSPERNELLMELVKIIALPTLQLNNNATLERASSVAAAIPPIYYYIQKGEKIVTEGDIVSREQQLKMQILYRFAARKIDYAKSLGVFVLSLCLVYGLFFSPASLTGTKLYPRIQYFISFLLLSFSLLCMLVGFYMQTNLEQSQMEIWAFAVPIASASGISALVFSARRFFSFGLLVSLFATLFLKGNIALFLFFFISSMLNTLLIIRSQSRQDVVTSTSMLFLGQLFFGFGAILFNLSELTLLPYFLLAITINTLLCLFFVFALSPIVELFFNLTTRFRLMELMNLEQPLLQELMMTAPGTYHHSVIVSNLVEAGANAINANSLLCKVAALYHDIGKIARPEYFIENQFNIANKHDSLAPAMSALIIISHIKQGVELAEKYNLGKEIIDLIKQHHGNRCMTFFYNKALHSHKGEGDCPQESEYRYPYKKPQTKEAALLMLADAIEASSRTLIEPTPGDIRNHVNKIVQGIYAEGQLDESELTFKDLNAVSEAFILIVVGLFHHRIMYPEAKKS